MVAKTVPEAIDWYVPGFLAAGAVTELDGKLKASGKTTFVGRKVRAIVTGAPFLGLPTKRTAVLWLTEERPVTFAETLKRAGLEDREDVHVLHWHDVKGRPWHEVMHGAITYAKSVGAGVIVVDTIGQWGGLRGETENTTGGQLDAVAPLQQAAHEGLAVIVTRHERKGGGEVGESGRGGSAFSGAVDIVISLRRGEGSTRPTVRVLHGLSRFTETPDSLVIELTEAGYVALGAEGAVAVLEAEGAITDRLPDTEDRAMDVETLRLIEPAISRPSALKALKGLYASGRIRRCGSGKRGDPHRYFSAVVSVSTQIPTEEQKQESGVWPVLS